MQSPNLDYTAPEHRRAAAYTHPCDLLSRTWSLVNLVSVEPGLCLLVNPAFVDINYDLPEPFKLLTALASEGEGTPTTRPLPYHVLAPWQSLERPLGSYRSAAWVQA